MSWPLVAAFAVLTVLSHGPTVNAQYAPPGDRYYSTQDSAGARKLPPDLRTGSFLSAPLPPATDSRNGVRLSGGGKHLIVEGTLNSALSGPMLVDTGASYCILTRASAHRLGLAPSGKETISVATANGDVAADLIQLTSVQIANARLARVDALIMDAVEPPLIGILGLSFLNHFRYSVDSARGTIHLEY
jgi:clan AA aspartic protease (TIGR02281 family)